MLGPAPRRTWESCLIQNFGNCRQDAKFPAIKESGEGIVADPLGQLVGEQTTYSFDERLGFTVVREVTDG